MTIIHGNPERGPLFSRITIPNIEPEYFPILLKLGANIAEWKLRKQGARGTEIQAASSREYKRIPAMVSVRHTL